LADSSILGIEDGMVERQEMADLDTTVERLTAENDALRAEGFRGSKAEALMALEYDRIPNVLKTAKAITLQRKFATFLMVVVPLLVLMIAIIGGWNAYQDWQASAAHQRKVAEAGNALGKSVEDALKN
jgi:hypothetical protein